MEKKLVERFAVFEVDGADCALLWVRKMSSHNVKGHDVLDGGVEELDRPSERTVIDNRT